MTTPTITVRRETYEALVAALAWALPFMMVAEALYGQESDEGGLTWAAEDYREKLSLAQAALRRATEEGTPR